MPDPATELSDVRAALVERMTSHRKELEALVRIPRGPDRPDRRA